MTYRGIIIEESLSDKTVIDSMTIVATKVEAVTPQHKTPWVQNWTLHTVEIANNKAEETAARLNQSLDKDHAWYADFKNERTHFVIFKDQFFKIDRSHLSHYDEAIRHGLSLGIPDYQLDFSSAVEEWARTTK